MPFEVPERDELAERLASVLEAIYLIFNEGYAATAGDDWIRPELIEEALRLGRILAELLPSEPEVHGLVALMELHASRSRARDRPLRRGGTPARPGPVALGLAARRPRPRRARSRAEHRWRPGAVHAPGGHRRLPRTRPSRRRHGLGAHRRPLRWARPASALAGRRAQPRGRRRDGVRPRGGARTS